MKRLFFASLYALIVAGFGFAIAQSITKSVQLSQDGSGPIGFDTSSNVYFPAHVNGQGGLGTITGCGTSAILNANSTDFGGSVTEGTGSISTTCTLTFKTAYLSTPFCTTAGNSTAASPVGLNATPNGIQFLHTANSAATNGQLVINYICVGGRAG